MAVSPEHIFNFSAVVASTLFLYDSSLNIWTKNLPPMVEGSGRYEGAAHAGETVLIDWAIAKRTSCAGTSSRVWRGEDGFYLVEVERPTRLPHHDDFRNYQISTEIPSLAPAGDLSLEIAGSYKCKGTRSFEFVLGPVEIKVVE